MTQGSPTEKLDRLLRQGEADAIDRRAARSPWYFAAPTVALGCLKTILLPFDLLVRVAETLLAVAVLGVGLVVWMWSTGRIADQQVIEYLIPLGRRIATMLSSVAG